MKKRCLLTQNASAEGAHVVDKGPECRAFKSAYSHIYPDSEYFAGVEDAQNIVFLREDIHRGPMDNICLPLNLRVRRLGFDFINRISYIMSFETGEIEGHKWSHVPDVKREYFAWSNNNCSKKLRKYLRKIDRRLIDYNHWTENN